MLLVQMTGLSGAGKTSIGRLTTAALLDVGHKVEMMDADEYRKDLCRDLGYSRGDRLENIRRMGIVGLKLAGQGIISILAAINPYEEGRAQLRERSELVRTVFIDCPISITRARDMKGLYRQAALPIGHAEHIGQFTGVSDPYETPLFPDLIIRTDLETLEESVRKLTAFILENILPDH